MAAMRTRISWTATGRSVGCGWSRSNSSSDGVRHSRHAVGASCWLFAQKTAFGPICSPIPSSRPSHRRSTEDKAARDTWPSACQHKTAIHHRHRARHSPMRPPTTTDARGTLLVFGAGFIGEHVARRAAEHGYAVLGTTRRLAGELAKQRAAAALQRLGAARGRGRRIAPIQRDAYTLDRAAVRRRRPGPWQHRGRLRGSVRPLKWIGHVSTAAVYGAQPHIDASSVPRPGTYGGRLRMLIEREWAALALPPTADPVRIFRPTSVYGPWRGPQQSLRQGMAAAIEKPDHVVSRIHVDDVAAAVLASMEQSLGVFSSDGVQEGGDAATAEADGCPIEGAGCSTYLLADEEPASPAEVLREAAKIYGCPAPEAISYDQIESGLSADARAFWSHPVRAASGGALGALGVRLAYPNYREGLAAVRDVEASPIELPSPPAADEAPATPPSPPPPKPRRAKAAKAAPKKEATAPPVAEEDGRGKDGEGDRLRE